MTADSMTRAAPAAAPRLRLADVLKHVDIAAVGELAEALLEAGHSRDDIVHDVAGIVDQLLPFSVLVPGPAGLALEAIDGPVLLAIVRLVVVAAERRIKARK